jgi:tRNA threonylcarbamoyladenosine biosynthesis protein TsaE
VHAFILEIAPPVTAALPSLTLHWPDEAATQTAAARLAHAPDLPGALVLLEGDLGAGKTTFVRGLLRALGVAGRIKSPSYAVLESHPLAQGHAHHFDFYRFGDPREWEDAGFRELLAGPDLKLVEWPDKAAGLLGAADLRLRLQADVVGDGRVVHAQALSPRGARLLEAWA